MELVDKSDTVQNDFTKWEFGFHCGNIYKFCKGMLIFPKDPVCWNIILEKFLAKENFSRVEIYIGFILNPKWWLL